MIPESKLYTFYDEANGFTLTFFEGQKLITDLAVLNNLQGSGFAFFRDSVLGIEPMISFLKNKEGIGVYIDSNDPYFRLKLETNQSGQIRTLLLPEDFNQSPTKITGMSRLTKTFVGGMQPYTSVVELKGISFKEIVNQILQESYQVNAEIFVSEVADQSVMVMKLPNPNVDIVDAPIRQSVEQYYKTHKPYIDKLHEAGETDETKIIKSFEELGFTFLRAKEVKFQCTCSKERMIAGLKSIANKEDLFSNGEYEIETRCDYCKKTYKIRKDEII